MSEGIRVPKSSHHLDYARDVMSGKREPPPIATLLGFTMREADVGRAVFEMDVGPKYSNPMGTLHGGILCDLADIAMGVSMATTLEADESFTTIDLGAKYLKPVWKTRLRAKGQVVKRTRSLGLIECEVTDEAGSLVAKVWSTCMVLRGEEAKGR